MTVPVLSEGSLSYGHPKLRDMSPGMNLYPRTHSFVLGDYNWKTSVVKVEAGWNLLYVGKMIPNDAEIATTAEWRPFTLSENTYRFPDSGTGSSGSFAGLWYRSDSAMDLSMKFRPVVDETLADISLTSGWNIIGHNLNRDVAWNSARVSIIANGTSLSVLNAVSQGYIEDRVYSYENGKYTALSSGANLKANHGYFIKAKKPCSLKIAP